MKLMNRVAQIFGYVAIFIGFILLLYLGFNALIGKKKHNHKTENVSSRNELVIESPIKLNTNSGSEIGIIYESYLSPHQEGGEEDETPEVIPKEFHSSKPSVLRINRNSRGHSIIAFSKDLSRANIFLKIDNLDPQEINMLHIHCGRPGQLGPILVDFALIGDYKKYLEDGVMKIEVKNEDILATSMHGEGLIAAFTSGCPIIPLIPNDKVKTIAGMEYIARQGDLYFNVHTKAQTFFGEMRGQFHLVQNKN